MSDQTRRALCGIIGRATGDPEAMLEEMLTQPVNSQVRTFLEQLRETMGQLDGQATLDDAALAAVCREEHSSGTTETVAKLLQEDPARVREALDRLLHRGHLSMADNVYRVRPMHGARADGARIPTESDA